MRKSNTLAAEFTFHKLAMPAKTTFLNRVTVEPTAEVGRVETALIRDETNLAIVNLR